MMIPLRPLVFGLAITLIGYGAVMASPAFAADHGGQHGSMETAHHAGMMGHGMGHGMAGKTDHRFAPHNAAVHFLKMAEKLHLDMGQKEKIRQLRDTYIGQFAIDSQRLAAAESDLKAYLFSDTIRMDRVEATLVQIGKLEGKLWRGFAKQLSDIKAMLSAEQKSRLKALHKSKHHAR